MNKAVIVLANNTDYFKLLINNYQPSVNADLIAINEDRIGDKSNELSKLAKTIKGANIVNQFAKEVTDTPYLREYCMGLKLLIPWWASKYYDQFLVIDEDVILNDLTPIFGNNHGITYYRMSAGPSSYDYTSKQARVIFNELDSIFGFDSKKDYSYYLNHYVSAGNIFYDGLDNDYTGYLKQFFESDIFYNDWLHRRSYKSRYIDEKFLTYYFFNKEFRNLKKHIHITISKPEKVTDKQYAKGLEKAIFHVACCTRKNDCYNRLIKAGLIKGTLL